MMNQKIMTQLMSHIGDEPQYINGKKVYHVELWDYVAEDDWWMHQTCFISKDGLE